MQRVKRRTFSGVVCEQEVFNVSDRLKDIKTAEPRQRFKTEEEREQHRIGISRRKHARLVNENFSPRSLYSTLTFDDEHEVHTFKDAKRIRDLYVRRLKYAFPDAVIFVYMGRGKARTEYTFICFRTACRKRLSQSNGYTEVSSGSIIYANTIIITA